MASSAVQTNGFVDPYEFNYKSYYDQVRGYNTQDNPAMSYGFTGETGLPGLLGKLFGYDSDQQKAMANRQAEQEYERQSIQSARAWSEYMDNTQYQRRVADLKKAGLNPWLAVQNGISGSGAPSVDTGGSAQNQNRSDQSLSALGSLLMAIAKLVG